MNTHTHTCILLTACSCVYFNNKKPFPDPSPGYISCSLATLQISNTTDRPISWLSFFTEHLVGEMCVSVKLKMINRQKEVWNPSGVCGGRLQAEDGSLTKTLVVVYVVYEVLAWRRHEHREREGETYFTCATGNMSCIVWCQAGMGRTDVIHKQIMFTWVCESGVWRCK